MDLAACIVSPSLAVAIAALLYTRFETNANLRHTKRHEGKGAISLHRSGHGQTGSDPHA